MIAEFDKNHLIQNIFHCITNAPCFQGAFYLPSLLKNFCKRISFVQYLRQGDNASLQVCAGGAVDDMKVLSHNIYHGVVL